MCCALARLCKMPIGPQEIQLYFTKQFRNVRNTRMARYSPGLGPDHNPLAFLRYGGQYNSALVWFWCIDRFTQIQWCHLKMAYSIRRVQNMTYLKVYVVYYGQLKQLMAFIDTAYNSFLDLRINIA